MRRCCGSRTTGSCGRSGRSTCSTNGVRASRRGIPTSPTRRSTGCNCSFINYAGTGWGLSFWHGARVPDDWIARKDSLDPSEVIKADNVEQRAAGAAICGWPKLIELTLPGLPEPGRFLKACCPRNGIIVEGVPRVSDIDGQPIETAIAAQAWRIGDPQSEYAHPPMRT